MGRLFFAQIRGGRYAAMIVLLVSFASSVVFVETSSAEQMHALQRLRLRDGTNPMGSLIADSSGSLYGTTSQGTASNAGSVYKLTPTPSGYEYTLLHTFGSGDDGSSPESGLVMDGSGALFGTTQVGGNAPSGASGTVFKMTPSGSGYTFSSLYTFLGREHGDGAYPMASVTIGANGVLYGVTTEGGSSNWCAPGCGVAFMLTPIGSSYHETILHTFEGAGDGATPLGNLVLDHRGNLYGVTAAGGSGCHKNGCGTIFRIDPGNSARERTIYRFGGAAQHDGAEPEGPLVVDSRGEIFGVTNYGGSQRVCGADGCGTVFRLSRSASGYVEDIIYNFTGGRDGAGPLSGLVADGHGNLFGTTSYGGNTGCSVGCGTVFELVRHGSGYHLKVLHTFQGGLGGWFSEYNPLYIDAADDVFGATYYGGYSGKKCTVIGCGTIFELSNGP